MRKTDIIETERLILRPFTKNDGADMLEYLNEPAVNCFRSMKINDLREAQTIADKRGRSISSCYFAICLKQTGKVIGEIFSFRDGHEKDTLSPCWMLNEKYQHCGYAYEAASAYIGYLFTKKSARRIYAYTEDYNISCQKLCEKLGMRREGLFIEFVSFVNNADGTPKYENTYQYAILKKEWESKC